MMNQSAQNAEPEASQSSPTAVVQLYDTVLRHISQASDAARDGNFQKQFDEVMSATRIIDGLNRHLDMEQGGQVALNLRDMYQSVGRALLRSVGKDDAAEAYAKMTQGLKETRNAWAGISGMPAIS